MFCWNELLLVGYDMRQWCGILIFGHGDQTRITIFQANKMLRPYAIKGKKRKNRGEKYDKEEQVEEGEEKEMAKPAAIENPTEEVEALLSILDSPINKARRLQAVYVRTEKGVLFEVKPHVRIPRTYKLFLIDLFYKNAVQLIQNLNITAVGKREKVLQVIKNHVTNYFLINSHKIDKLVKMRKYVDAVGDDVNLVFV
ncbi:hypothetical protein Goari_006334, partial [Gossypium aridum]|nr:hypothetical protein [Gossypium aridum]